jgi:hypothetical protein
VCVAKRKGLPQQAGQGGFSPFVTWSGRIGHVLLCALLGAPFGVLLLVVIGLAALVSWVSWLPLLQERWWIQLPSIADTERTVTGSEKAKALLILLAVFAILILCYILGDVMGVLIGGAILGALIGATLSILSQWPEKPRPPVP